MNERKVKRLAYEKPYLFDNAYLLSRSEAQRLISHYGSPSLARVVALAQSKGILGEDACSEIDRMVERYEKRTGFAAWLRKVGRGTVDGIRRHKRLAIIALVILLLAGFFGLTPTGRAIAEDIRRVIVSLFEDGFEVEVKPKGDEEKSEDVISHDITEYSSIEDFEVATGLNAVYVDNDEVNLNIITQHEYMSKVLLSTVYETIEGGIIEVQQVWYEDSAYYVGEKLPIDEWIEFRSKNSLTFYYFVNSLDASFSAVATTTDSGIYITGNNPYSAVSFLDDLQYTPS